MDFARNIARLSGWAKHFPALPCAMLTDVVKHAARGLLVSSTASVFSQLGQPDTVEPRMSWSSGVYMKRACNKMVVTPSLDPQAVDLSEFAAHGCLK